MKSYRDSGLGLVIYLKGEWLTDRGGRKFFLLPAVRVDDGEMFRGYALAARDFGDGDDPEILAILWDGQDEPEFFVDGVDPQLMEEARERVRRMN